MRVQCSTSWAIRATGSWSLCESMISQLLLSSIAKLWRSVTLKWFRSAVHMKFHQLDFLLLSSPSRCYLDIQCLCKNFFQCYCDVVFVFSAKEYVLCHSFIDSQANINFWFVHHTEWRRVVWIPGFKGPYNLGLDSCEYLNLEVGV